MSAWEEFELMGLGSVFNLSSIFNNSTFDANINSSDGFEMKGGMKNIYWKGDHAYARQKATNKEVRFHALHFNATAKQHMLNAFMKKPLWADREHK